MSDLTHADEPSEALDARVLHLRNEGQAFARISRDLQLHRSLDAQRAFLRALRRLPEPDADVVRAAESTRLDRLARQVQGDARKSDLDRARQLKTIEGMRSQVNEKG